MPVKTSTPAKTGHNRPQPAKHQKRPPEPAVPNAAVSTMSMMFRFLLGTLLAAPAGGSAYMPAEAAPARKPARPARPTAAAPAGLVKITVEPAKLVLSGRDVSHRLMVLGHHRDGRVRDLTSQAKLSAGDSTVVRVSGPRVVSNLDGTAKVTAAVGGVTGAATVTVQDVDTPAAWSFANEIVPVLTKAGCNTGACHGSPSGRGGFRLSLFGYDPDEDYKMVVEERGGRRVNKNQAAQSLILQKATAKVTHGGGPRFREGSAFYSRLLAWLKAGAPMQPEFDPRIARIEVYPRQWTLDRPQQTQQIMVSAVRDDGSYQEVTEYARFDTNNDQVAEVDSEGMITAVKPGETSIMVRYLSGVDVVPVNVPRPPVPESAFAAFKPVNYIDQLVLAKLKEVRIPPSELAGDAEFLRRAYLDVCGIAPSVEEARGFLDSKAPDKRERLVDELLNRPEFVDYWTLRWSDLFRNNQQAKKDKGLQVFYRWIRDGVRENKPWDAMARELILAAGSGYRTGPANFYNLGEIDASEYPLYLASQTSQVFLGVRIDCARCHNHPFESWSQVDYYGLAAFFARTKSKAGPDEDERIYYPAAEGEVFHPRTPRSGPRPVMQAKLLGGNPVTFGPEEDRREKLAQWITSPANPWFKRSIANRVWNNFFGRGIIHPVDDYRLTNPAANEKLLEALGEKVVQYRFNLKLLMRDIMLSRTYQASSIPTRLNQDDHLYASHALPRRLYAEVLLDCISSATGVPERIGPYARAVAAPDNRIRNDFLDIFGRARRDVACECERPEETNVSMVLNLMNGGTINSKITHPSGRVAQVVGANKSAKEIIEEFYLAALSRPPAPKEQAAAEKLLASAPNLKEGAEDLMWGLLNTKEFLFNH
jgi:hypothetical protein